VGQRRRARLKDPRLVVHLPRQEEEKEKEEEEGEEDEEDEEAEEDEEDEEDEKDEEGFFENNPEKQTTFT
jgi:hypothetical protein